MKTKCSLSAYLFHLKHIMVAPKLIGVLHCLAQIGVVIAALFAIISAMKAGTSYRLIVLLGCIIGVPLVSFVIRAYFELIMVPFSLSKNVSKIKKGLFGCDCGCDCNFAVEEDRILYPEETISFDTFTAEPEDPMSVRPIKKSAPAKKETKKAAPKKAPVKKEAVKKEVAKKAPAKKPAKKSK